MALSPGLAIVAHLKQHGRMHPAFLLFWIALAAAAYFAMDALVKPKVASVSVIADGAREIVISRSRDGHYYVAGTINGHPMTFMVDTGASTVVVDAKLAQAWDLPKGRRATFNTASGPAEGEIVANQHVSVGDVRADRISVAVIEGLGDYGLLGQNFLRHVDVLQSGSEMKLRVRSTAAPHEVR